MQFFSSRHFYFKIVDFVLSDKIDFKVESAFRYCAPRQLLYLTHCITIKFLTKYMKIGTAQVILKIFFCVDIDAT